MPSWFGFFKPNNQTSSDAYDDGEASYIPRHEHGAPGYGDGYSLPAPPRSTERDSRMQQFFAADRDGNGSLTAQELQGVLANDNWSMFHPDTVRFLIRLFDADRSTTIGFEEFCNLLSYLQAWHNVFESFDTNRNGTIEGFELHDALPRIGFNLTPKLISLVEQKYGDESGVGGVTFDRFVRACVFIKHITDSFARLAETRSGMREIGYEQLMQVILLAP